MIELFIGGGMLLLFIFLLGGRRSDHGSRSFVPDDRVAPTTSSGSYEAGLAGCPDGTCIASRQSQLTGWTVDRHISQAYPDRLTGQPQPSPRVHAEPARAKSSFIPNDTDIELDDNSRYPTYGDILIEDQQEQVRVRLRR